MPHCWKSHVAAYFTMWHSEYNKPYQAYCIEPDNRIIRLREIARLNLEFVELRVHFLCFDMIFLCFCSCFWILYVLMLSPKIGPLSACQRLARKIGPLSTDSGPRLDAGWAVFAFCLLWFILQRNYQNAIRKSPFNTRCFYISGNSYVT